jgi:hypothetical protein
MNLLHLSLVLLVVISTTSDVLGGASRGQEQDLRRYLRISCYNDKEEAHGRMNSSKMEARATQSNQEAKSTSGIALKSESGLHRSQVIRGRDWQEQEEKQSPY